jgi:hypothetical protein
VKYQVEGRVRQTSDRVRVAAQLVDTGGRVLWSARFDEPFQNLFELQDRITSQIAGALAIGVADSEQRRVFAKPSDNPEAYDYVLRARPALQRPTVVPCSRGAAGKHVRSEHGTKRGAVAGHERGALPALGT